MLLKVASESGRRMGLTTSGNDVDLSTAVYVAETKIKRLGILRNSSCFATLTGRGLLFCMGVKLGR